MDALEEFMSHPLVVWVTTFKDGSLDYMNLVDGTFLNDVMAQIDPRPNALKVNREVNAEVSLRIQNLDTLMKNIKAFYLDILDQLLVMKLPNILLISKDPMSETALGEMLKLLLLLLGCAVQSSQKEIFIEHIKQLEIDVQHAIVVHIQKITDNAENVVNLQLGEVIDAEQQDGSYKDMFSHVKRLVMERDDYAETIMELSQEKEIYQATIEGRRIMPSPTSPGSDRRHITVELAETKAKLRRIRQELEEKNEVTLEYKEEIDKYNVTVQKLRQENLELSQDARLARLYRDEVDVWKEKASKVEKYEKEIARYREKLNELEYLKRRVEELREDNQLLHETRGLLEDQLEATQHKVEKGREAEAEGMRLKAQLEALEDERDSDQSKIQELVAEVSKLQLDHKQSLDESASLGMELEKAKNSLSPLGNSLSAECNESASSRILRLERENQRLVQEIESLKDVVSLKSNSQLLEMEKENKQLSRKVEILQVTSNTEIQTLQNAVSRVTDLESEKEEQDRKNRLLQKSLDALKPVQDKATHLELDNKKLEVEKKRLEGNLQLTKSQLDKLEKENQDMEGEIEQLKKNLDGASLIAKRVDELEAEQKNSDAEKMGLEKERSQLNKENKRLRQSLGTREQLIDEANSRIQTLDQENRQLQKVVNKSKDAGERLKELEKDNKEYLKQATIDKKTLATLREELVNEKIKGQQMSNDLEKLTTELEKIGLDKNRLLHEEVRLDETRYKSLQKRMEDAVQRNLLIKEERITDLETRLQDTTSQNLKLVEELKVNKRVYEVLIQGQEEEKTKSSPGDAKLKRLDSDHVHLVELERSNATLLAENNSLQGQLDSLRSEGKALQGKVQSSQERQLSIQSQQAHLQVENNTLQSQQAKLQVENSTLQSHNASLQSQYAAMQAKLTSHEADYDRVKERLSELLGNYEAMLGDHETLVQLHDTLSSEYEALTAEYKALKALHREMKTEMADLRNRCRDAEIQSQEVERMQTAVREEEKKLKRMRTDNLSIDTLQLGFDSLSFEHITLNKEYKDVDEQLKKLKAQHRNLQLEYTSLNGYLNEMKDQCTSAEMDSAKLSHRCEMLHQLNSKLEEENHKLMEQLSQLLAQNSEMLVDALETKEYHHEEQHVLEEQLHNLRRQKEKLEEKIMDQYKNYIYTPPKKSKGLNLNFMKKIYRRGRSTDRDRRKKTQEIHQDSADGLSGAEKDSLGETSSAGSGIDSLDGAAILNPDGTHKIERRGSDENNAVMHRRRDYSGMRGHYRKSMPSHVLESHPDANMPSKGAYSMSVEDLRRSKETRSHSVSSVEPKYTSYSSIKKVRRRSMYDYDQPASSISHSQRHLSQTSSGAHPGLSEGEEFPLSPICHSPTATPPHLPFPDPSPSSSSPLQPTDGSPRSVDDNTASCDEDSPSLRGSPRGSPRDGLPPSGRSKRSSGMLSRIKSRSREILSDMKMYSSTPNLAQDITYTDEADSPRAPDAADSPRAPDAADSPRAPDAADAADDSPRSDKYNGEDSARLPLPDAVPSSPQGNPESEDIITPMRHAGDLHSAPPSTLDRKRAPSGESERKRQNRYSMPEPPKLMALAQEFGQSPPQPLVGTSSKGAPLASPVYSARPYSGRSDPATDPSPVPSQRSAHKIHKPRAQYPAEGPPAAGPPAASPWELSSKEFATELHEQPGKLSSTPETRYRSNSSHSPEAKTSTPRTEKTTSPNSNSNSNSASLGWAIPSFENEEDAEPSQAKTKSPTKTEQDQTTEEGQNGENKGSKKKSSVWYEYGCV